MKATPLALICAATLGLTACGGGGSGGGGAPASSGWTAGVFSPASAYEAQCAVPRTGTDPERLRITLAVAGFTREQMEITLEENQLTIRGRQVDDTQRHYLHRGIAARQFQRSFLLAEGMEVTGADLANGLLAIDLARPEPERLIRRITIA